MSSVDTWNKKLWPKIKRDTHLWLSLTQESSLLWLQFIGKSEWPAGYWVKHQKTDYLDIQLVEKGNMTVKQHGKNYLIEENKIVLMPPGAYTLSTGPAGHLKKRYLGLKGILVAQHQKKLGLERINIFAYHDADDFDKIFAGVSKLGPESKKSVMT